MSIDELQSVITTGAERVGPSVVGIGSRWGIGSGIVIAPGRVLTNAHNLRGEEATVTWADGRSSTATVEGIDVDGDLAVVAADTGEAEPPEWAPGEGASLGTPVVALSNPGGRGLRATLGFVSATARSFRGPRGRRITGSLEHTAPLVRGSSGGPLLDERGRLLGINTNRLGEGFYLAIPADASLRARVDALGRGESPATPRLGIGVAPADIGRRLRRSVGLPDVDGLLVRVVEEGSPAEAAGIREGDLVVEVAGRTLSTPDDLLDALDAAGAGAPVEVTVMRGAERLTLSASLGGRA